MDLNALLRRAVELGASDIHFKLDQPPMLRRDGVIAPLEECPELTEQNLLAALEAVTRVTPERLKTFHETGDLDIAYTAEGLPRFRVNAFRQRGNISFAFRVIPRDVPSFEALQLPPGVKRLAEEHRGLVLCTGATGSGKTTTLASMIDHINRTRHQHIVTIEDPIEILHPDRNCIVNQREVGLDTESFAQGLRRVLRQDPDTILIGELRDAETAQTALQAAESGHLVFSTLHTIDAAETVGRMIEFFPPGEAAADPFRARRRAARRDQPAAAAAARRRPGRCRRGDGHERPHLRSDPRGAHRGDLRRRRRGQLLPDADLPAGADRARAGGQRRAGRSPRTPPRTTTTFSSRSTTPSSSTERTSHNNTPRSEAAAQADVPVLRVARPAGA